MYEVRYHLYQTCIHHRGGGPLGETQLGREVVSAYGRDAQDIMCQTSDRILVSGIPDAQISGHCHRIHLAFHRLQCRFRTFLIQFFDLVPGEVELAADLGVEFGGGCGGVPRAYGQKPYAAPLPFDHGIGGQGRGQGDEDDLFQHTPVEARYGFVYPLGQVVTGRKGLGAADGHSTVHVQDDGVRIGPSRVYSESESHCVRG